MAILTFGGGINEQDDISISLDECIAGTNFRLDNQQRSYRPRPPFDLLATAPNAEEIRGIMQLIKKDDTKTNLVQAGDTLYSVDSGFVFTSEVTVAATSKLRGSHWALDDVLVITDLEKDTTVREWDGTTVSVMAHTIAGVTDLYAKYSVAEYNGRNWLFNVTTDTDDNPHVILASEFENHDNFDNSARGTTGTFATGNEPFFLTAPDGRPINGAVRYFDTLLISTEGGKLFRLVGNDANNYQIVEFYAGSAAIGAETIVNIGNDAMFMRRGGNIEFLSSTERAGEISSDEASRWIENTVADLTDAIAIYNQKDQLVHFFVQDKVLTFDKEVFLTTQLSPWIIDTTLHPSGFNTQAATYMKRADSDVFTVYWGDSDGNLFDLNGVGEDGDAGDSTVQTFRKTRLITELDNIREIIRGRVVYRRRGIASLQMVFEWSEAYVNTTAEVPLKAPVVSLGSNFYSDNVVPVGYNLNAYYNAGGLEQDLISTAGFTPSGKGHSFFLTTSLNTNINFLINRLETRNEARQSAEASF